MARTSRTAANNLGELDNIDLDAMFDDDSDEIFAGIDIPIVDEIDTPTSTTKETKTQNKKKTSSNSSKSKVIPSAPSRPEAKPTNVTGSSVATSRSRRQTKRKALMDADDDDSYEEPPPKKTKKKGGNRKKTTTKKTSDSSTPLNNSVSLPPPTTKQKPSSGPLPAFAYPKSVPLKSSPTPSHSSINSISTHLNHISSFKANGGSVAGTGASLKRKAPPRTQFCGISPSNTVFFPFLDLPTEFLLKSKKPYLSVDKIHTTLQTHLQDPTPTQPNIGTPKNDHLVRLIQDGSKADPAAVVRAVTAMRNTPTPLEPSDWHTIAQLLQRQHDFLQQSAANMQSWCRKNFSDEHYADVYSILGTFQSKHIRVKVIVGKDKTKTLLPAVLPFDKASTTTATTTTRNTVNNSTNPAENKSVPPSKRPKPKRPEKTTTTTTTTTTTKTPPPTPYAHLCSAAARRKAIADRLSQVAPVAARTPSSSTTLAAGSMWPPTESMPTTHSLWKWLDQAGYWGTASGSSTTSAVRVEPWQVPRPSDPEPALRLTVEDRVASLLVEEIDEDAMDTDDDDDANDEIEIPTQSTEEVMDASGLTMEERWRWTVRGWGEYVGPVEETTTSVTEVEETINTMIADLNSTDELNNARLDFLESVLPSGDEQKRIRNDQASLIAKCQQLLKKTKEQKAKAAASKRDDKINLPW